VRVSDGEMSEAMEINWEEVAAFERDGLDEDDENYWVPQILDFEPDSEESRENLVALFKLTKAVLSAKVAEVRETEDRRTVQSCNKTTLFDTGTNSNGFSITDALVIHKS
jgi:hypothetical protein